MRVFTVGRSRPGLSGRRPMLQLGVALVLGAMGGGAIAAGSVAVSQRNRSFDQKTVTLSRGDTVRIDNQDEFVHHIYVDAGSMKFDSAEQAPGKAVEVRFPALGTFEVRCRIHPRMVLTVDVR